VYTHHEEKPSVYTLHLTAHLPNGGVQFTHFASSVDIESPHKRESRRPGWLSCLRAWVEADLHDSYIYWDEDEMTKAVWVKLGEVQR